MELLYASKWCFMPTAYKLEVRFLPLSRVQSTFRSSPRSKLQTVLWTLSKLLCRAQCKKTVVAFLAEVCKTFDLAYIWSESRQTGMWIGVLTKEQRNQEHTAWFRPLSIDEHCQKQSSKKGDHFAFAVVEDCSQNAVLSPVCAVLSTADITQ